MANEEINDGQDQVELQAGGGPAVEADLGEAPQPASEPAEPAPGEGKDEVSPPAPFDPATINPEDADALSMLTEQELQQVEDYHSKQRAEPEKKDTPAPAAGAQPGEQPKLYAGKYKTTDDLLNGIKEAAKVLNANTAFMQPLIDHAVKTGSWEAVEASYQSMNAEIGRKGNPPQSGGLKEGEPGGATPTPTESPDTFMANPEVINAVGRYALSTLAGSPLAEEMKSKGIAPPANAQEFDELKLASPYYAWRWETDFNKLYQDGLKLAKTRFDSLRSVEGHNQQEMDSGLAAVRERAKQLGLTLDEQAEKALVEAVNNDPTVFEDRNGVKFLRKGAVVRAFNSGLLVDHLPEILLRAEQRGREQAAKDLTKPRVAPIASIGTKPIAGGPPRSQGRKVDLNDPDALQRLSDREIEELTR